MPVSVQWGRGTGCICISDSGCLPQNKGTLLGDLQGTFLTALRRASLEIWPLAMFPQMGETAPLLQTL